MAFYQAHYLLSTANRQQWPASQLPEVLLVGRSNVGKSSLLNSLFNNKKLAYIGKTPGKTRLLNFFLSKDIMFVDAPGYGFSSQSKREIVGYQSMMEDYLTKRENLRLIIWLLDIRRDVNDDDLLMKAWFESAKHPYLILLNKADKLSNNQLLNQKTKIAKQLGISSEQLLVYSTKTALGREILLEKLQDLAYNES